MHTYETDEGVVEVYESGSGIGIDITNEDDLGEVYVATAYLTRKQAVDLFHMLMEVLD